MNTISTLAVCAVASAAINSALRADTFGSGANTFTIAFVNIGNPGNEDDAGAGGIYSSPYGGVPYNYRVGTYEISQDTITKATASGLANVSADAWTGDQPAASMTWYEAAAFVNFLNTSTGHQAAYQLDAGVSALTLWSNAQAWQTGGENLYRHKDAYYFLPSEDEWYKAAYHKNDGVTANYWDYAEGSNSVPTGVSSGTGAGTAVFDLVTSSPTDVYNNGGLSPYGARGMNGNVWEWQESAFDGGNDSPTEDRAIRSGSWKVPEEGLRSSFRFLNVAPTISGTSVGLRVASVPEPDVALTVLLGAGAILGFRRRLG